MWNNGPSNNEPDVDETISFEPELDLKTDTTLKSPTIGAKTELYETLKALDIPTSAKLPTFSGASVTAGARAKPMPTTTSRPWPRISVVIPAKNEALNLPHVLARIPKDVLEVILVDGNSTDGTVEAAQKHWPGVRVVHDTRRGKGNALACGFTAARGDIIVMLDADGSADGAEIPRFVRALVDGADVAKGSRFLKGGGSSDITRWRRMGNWVLTNIVNALFGTSYTDLCYGYNAFWTRHLPVLHVDCDGFEVETLINIRIAQAGLRVTEVPSFEANRIFGASNLHAVRDGIRVFKTIVRERQAGRQIRRETLAESHATLDVQA